MTAHQTVSRRRATATLGAALAAPMFFVRRAWSQDKAITVGIYGGLQGDLVRSYVIPKFEKNYACRVFQTQAPTLGQLAILRTQKANPQYSVMFMDDLGIQIAKAEDLITRLPADKMPNLAKLFPRYLLNGGYGAVFAIAVIAPFYNTDAVASVPSWDTLWDPRYAGRFMMVTPQETQSVQLLVAATSLATGKPFKEAQYLIDQGWQKMAALKPNVQTIYENNMNAALQIAQGQADIGGPDSAKLVIPYAVKGARLAMSAPREGVFAQVNSLALVKGGPNPDLAAAFANRMLDPSVQKFLAEATFAAPTVEGVDLSAQAAKILAYPERRIDEIGLAPIDWDFINPRRGAILDKFNQIFRT
jgi:putative spermidine/putrescine transport system substrate-binding protein